MSCGEELALLRAAVERVRVLCAERQAEGVDGGMADVDTLWPSEVLRELDAGPRP